MDAVIMDGRTLNIGAVTAIQEIVHPIRAARMVMDKVHLAFFVQSASHSPSGHVYLLLVVVCVSL